MALVVDLHYLVLDADLAIQDRELWWSAEWSPAEGDWEAEDSAQSLDEIVTAVLDSARGRGNSEPRIRWRLHQHEEDPSILGALMNETTSLPEQGAVARTSAA